MPLLLAESEIANLLRMEELIDLMERTLAEFSSGRALQPVRTALALEAHESFLATMPAYLAEGEGRAHRRARDAHAPRHRDALRSRERHPALDHGRAPDHRDAHRRSLGRRG